MQITILTQLTQGFLKSRADLISRPNLLLGSEWTLHQQAVQGAPSPGAGDHRPICNLAEGKTPSILCPSVETQGSRGKCIPPILGQPPGVGLPPNINHKEGSSQTKNLSPMRSQTDHTVLASENGFPDLLELLSDIPIELPKRQDLLRQPHFHRFHENLQMLRLMAWRLSNDSHTKQAPRMQGLANLPYAEENLLN